LRNRQTHVYAKQLDASKWAKQLDASKWPKQLVSEDDASIASGPLPTALSLSPALQLHSQSVFTSVVLDTCRNTEKKEDQSPCNHQSSWALPVFTAIDEPNHIHHHFDGLASTQSTGGSHASDFFIIFIDQPVPHQLQPKV
jgi:hypothetical protein